MQFPEVDVLLSCEEFYSIIDAMSNSAPGPDGIPYLAYKHGPVEIRASLYNAYLKWYHTATHPDKFNYAYLWLLTKR